LEPAVILAVPVAGFHQGGGFRPGGEYGSYREFDEGVS